MPHKPACLLIVFLASCGVVNGAKPAASSSSSSASTKTATKSAEANWWDAMTGAPNPAAAPQPSWIWGKDDAKPGEERFFRTTFDAKLPTTFMTENPSSAWIWCAADDETTVYLNGKVIARSGGWSRAVVTDVRALLRPGRNVLAAKCRNDVGIAAFALKLEIRGTYREPFTVVTDAKWTTWVGDRAGWRGPKFDEKETQNARVVGPYGMQPWGELPTAAPSQATPVEHITLPSGFKAELLYSVPKESQGSWVSMTPDPKGRLYVSDQSGPLFRVTPPRGDRPIEIERIDLDIGHAQGMLWAYDSLYVVVNSGRQPNPSGLYRLKDTDGDDELDQLTRLKHFLNRTGDGPGTSEHGPHAVVLGPDKKLYVVAGNFTSLPEDIAQTSPAANWAEDQLLQRMTDGRGHDPTIYAPGGWIARTDENGKTWEAFATGFRNAYDMAFNHDGELFTYDSDMEWDVGAPWWRPIRVDHVVSGGEFGWRNGSGTWRDYYPDQVPPLLNTGVGSPTGVTFGYGGKFPAKYQRAFYASDWAYGKIYAVHLTPDGAGYKATHEPFLVGKPFDVTDCVINPTDGAMYVTIGGRGTQSGLYRVTYAGQESAAAVSPTAENDSDEARQARQLRRKLESFHGRRDPAAVEFAWPHLGSEDRFIRYAARVAIESQDPATWQSRALAAKNPVELTNAMVALCRVGNASLQLRILDAMKRLDLQKLSEPQLLDALRAYQLCFIRMGRPTDPGYGPAVASRLEALYPNDDEDVNHELMQLLVYLESPNVIKKSLALLEKSKTQEDQLFYAFHLRNARHGWTLEHRQALFNWLNRAQASYTGGASYKIFLQNVRKAAIATLGDDERVALGELLKPPMEVVAGGPAADGPPRKFVKSWAMADLTPKLAQLTAGRSFASGKAAYDSLGCAKCHRFNGEGGGSGPDISGVGNRFQPIDLLEAIVLPSKIISDQYQATEIITKKKDVHVGTIHEENDQQVVIPPSPLSTVTETVKKDDINIRRPSKISIMPSGLIDVLKEDEVLDLLAYLRAAGDPKDPAFRKAGGDATPTTAASAK